MQKYISSFAVLFMHIHSSSIQKNLAYPDPVVSLLCYRHCLTDLLLHLIVLNL